MNIVIEGPDASGKSTLARRILQHIHTLRYTPGEGPPKYPGEMLDRVGKYLRYDNRLFDRHPCVSELIYGQFRKGGEIPEWMVDKFYASKPLFIYCYGRAGGHVADHQGDSPDHLEMIESQDDRIRNAYHEWATSHVPIHRWYHAGDPRHIQDIINLCKEFCHVP